MTQRPGYFTIAKGNCNSMKREIAGKITSEVKGRGETTAAVAKEANATSNGMPVQRAIFPAYVKLSIRVHQKTGMDELPLQYRFS